MAISRINDFYAATGQEQALRAFLESVLATIKGAAGCQEVALLVDQENAAHLVILERWDSVAAHQEAARLIPQSKLAEVAPLLAEPPRGRYYSRV
jgi:quinol monooxygenase YgiN